MSFNHKGSKLLRFIVVIIPESDHAILGLNHSFDAEVIHFAFIIDDVGRDGRNS